MFTLNPPNIEKLGIALSAQTNVTDREWDAIIQEAKRKMASQQTEIDSLIIANLLTVKFEQNDPLVVSITRS